MPESRHPEAVKLYRNVLKYSDARTAAEIAYGVDLPLCAAREQRMKWIDHISGGLERKFDENAIKTIRMGCYCTEASKFEETKAWIKALYLDSKSMAEFVDKMNARSAGWYIEDGALYTKFFFCECPMLEGVEALPTKTWCYCTAGYSKALFEDIFGYAVEVELLQSIKTGDDICLMRITAKHDDGAAADIGRGS